MFFYSFLKEQLKLINLRIICFNSFFHWGHAFYFLSLCLIIARSRNQSLNHFALSFYIIKSHVSFYFKCLRIGEPYISALNVYLLEQLTASVVDPDPYVFGPPGSRIRGTDPDPSIIKQK